jgi:integrase
MGRQRTSEFSHLPKGIYFNKKGQTYYFRSPNNKDLKLGKTLPEALRVYWSLPQMHYEAITMKELISRYMSEISPTKAPGTHRTNISAAKFLILTMGDFKPSQVKPIHVHQHLTARKDAPTRANREVALLGSIFNEAIRWGVVTESPVRDIKRYKEKPRTRLVTDAEIAAFKPHAPTWLQLYVDLKLLIALRQKDMRFLNSQMWFDGGLWVPTSKTGVKLRFNINQDMQLIYQQLMKLNGIDSDGKVTALRWWFFPSQNGKPFTESGFQTAWQRAMQSAIESGDLTERFQEKDLRAKAATDCDSIINAFELCGHSSLSTTKRIYRRGFNYVEPVNTANRLKKN